MTAFELIESNLAKVAAGPESLASEPRNPNARNQTDELVVAERSRPRLQDSADALMVRWEKACQESLSEARRAKESAPESPAAWSRLAHAEQCAGNSVETMEAAIRCLHLVNKISIKSGFQVVDYGSAVAAARTLAEEGYRERAQELLTELPASPGLLRLQATFAVDSGRPEQALELLAGDESVEAANLRGYIYLVNGDYRRALRELRFAWSGNNSRADTALNIALCSAHLGSTAKAISFARQASRIAPGRKDVSLTLLEFLLTSGKIDAAKREVAQLKSKNYVETLDFRLAQARLELAQGALQKGLTILKSAARSAAARERVALSHELEADIIYLESGRSERSTTIARTRVVRLIEKAPDSVALVETLASLSNWRSHETELAQNVTRVQAKASGPSLARLQAKLAYLACDFDKFREATKEVCETDPLFPDPWAQYAILVGQTTDDWKRAGGFALETLRRFGALPDIANNIAYTLAMAGKARIAQDVLDSVGLATFYRRATAGLVRIACGELDNGLRLYREAANQADKEKDGGTSRTLMTMHQGLAIRHLGLLSDSHKKALSARALPPAVPPNDWQNRPSFVLLWTIAQRRDWDWPLSIE